MEKTDEALVAEHLAGNEEALTRLLERHMKTVYSFILRSVEDGVEDVVQDTFLKVWKNMRKYEPRRASFKTWLMRIARNTVIDAQRKKKYAVFSDLENEYGDNRILDTPDSGPLPDEILAQVRDAHEVTEVLQKLPPQYREVLLLRYMSQMTFEEVSSVLHEPQNTVRSRHRRGLARLRGLLEDLHQKKR